MSRREQINIVIVGHVDHGKSTVIGRLLADTGSLPEGKLRDVQALCARTSKPFEYAFLLDALKDERSQGITIDSARCFFKTPGRDYIVIDAPGHIEFLKNMVSGAARAEAALLVISADEGVQENSKRHGYLVSMLGIRQVVVLINKMDLVGFDQGVYESLSTEYESFLSALQVKPISFIPLSARDGEGLTAHSEKMPWYHGPDVLEQLESFETKKSGEYLPLRFPVQDIYKFTETGDDRRILAGTIATGALRTGDEVLFLPSYKTSRITSIESFHTLSKTVAFAGDAVGVTLDTQLYIKPGEVIVRPDEEKPFVQSRFRTNIFWMGGSPLMKGKTYKLKLATCRIAVRVAEVIHVLDAADLSMTQHKGQLDRHDVGEVILETAKPIAFDPASFIDVTGRFVIVDQYEIAGGGIILDGSENHGSLLIEHVHEREIAWDKGFISPADRRLRNRHGSKFIVFTGESYVRAAALAKDLEHYLHGLECQVYYLGLSNLQSGIARDIESANDGSVNAVERLGELARILTDAGQILITAISGIDDYDLELLRILNSPATILVVCIGDPVFTRFDIDLVFPIEVSADKMIRHVYEVLQKEDVVPEYFI